MKTDGKDAAFASDGEYDMYGLTKREYFAAVAMQGLLACPHQMCGDIENQTGLAVEYADRLIAELNKEPTK